MDGWKASLTQWTWVWVNFRRWWWTGRPGVLLSMGLQRIVHNWVTELNWTDRMKYCTFRNCCINFSWKGISLWLIIILCESWGFCIFIGIICHWPCHNRMWWYFIASTKHRKILLEPKLMKPLGKTVNQLFKKNLISFLPFQGSPISLLAKVSTSLKLFYWCLVSVLHVLFSTRQWKYLICLHWNINVW